VNHLVAANEIEDYCLTVGHRIASLAPLAISVMKEEIRVMASAYSITPHMFERVQGLRRLVYDGVDYQEGIRAFKEKRTPVFTGR
jgi:methylmalonyl-CoA decarboxylase